MASVMQPLLLAAVPEILHLQAKPSYDRALTSSSTAASSRSVSPNDTEDMRSRNGRRFRTVGGIDASILDLEYPSGLVARDSDEVAPIRRSKTSPGLDDRDLISVAYPKDLVVRNTFLEFVEEPIFLQLRKVKSAPSSPVSSSTTMPVFKAPEVLELSSMLDAMPNVGSAEVPTIGSAKHHLGECKPCAFFWKSAGCGNGVDCTFCHLCDASEKKRRQKQKKALIKTRQADAI